MNRRTRASCPPCGKAYSCTSEILRGVSARTDDEPPICPVCGVTMVPAALSATDNRDGDWVCLECEETGADGA